MFCQINRSIIGKFIQTALQIVHYQRSSIKQCSLFNNSKRTNAGSVIIIFASTKCQFGCVKNIYHSYNRKPLSLKVTSRKKGAQIQKSHLSMSIHKYCYVYLLSLFICYLEGAVIKFSQVCSIEIMRQPQQKVRLYILQQISEVNKDITDSWRPIENNFCCLLLQFYIRTIIFSRTKLFLKCWLPGHDNLNFAL